MNYDEFDDPETIFLIKEGSEEAQEILYKKYKKLINFYANKMIYSIKNKSVDRSDLEQEGMLALNIAINTYDDSKNTTFSTYLNTLIRRRMLSLISSSNRQKHKILNESISIDTEGEDDFSIHEKIGTDSLNPSEVLLNLENNNDKIQKLHKLLTNLEKEVFNYQIKGYNYIEIAKLLKRTPKSVDNAIQRIKRKAIIIKEEV